MQNSIEKRKAIINHNTNTMNSLHKILDPIKSSQAPEKISSTRRRWLHIFSVSGPTGIVANTYPYSSPNWKSLCEPGSLPLTTDYFPSEKDL